MSATWRWDGSAWDQVVSGAPWDTGGDSVSLGGDPATGQVLAFTQRAQTWTWDGRHWTQRHPARSPAERIGPTLAFDAGRRQMLLVGGLIATGGGCQNQADTWTWDGSTWSELVSPRCPPRA